MVDIKRVRQMYAVGLGPVCHNCHKPTRLEFQRAHVSYICDDCNVGGCADAYRYRWHGDPDVLALCDELETARRQLAEAKELLKTAEWVEIVALNPRCPVCGCTENQGHALDCRLAAWLGEAKDG